MTTCFSLQFIHTEYVAGSAGVYNFKTIMGLSDNEAKEVSDHYPNIYAEFRIDQGDED